MTPHTDAVRWSFSPLGYGLLAFALLVAFTPYYGVLNGLFDVWNLQPEYSHGILIPLISLFLIWRQRDLLARTPFTGSWAGIPIMIGGALLWYIGELSTIYVIGQYAFLVELYGLILALVGPTAFRRLWMPLLILVFMIPLPAFFAGSLSLKLQLLSSALGVDVIRLFGIAVFLEGNVIDLGTYKLQVVEACSGLRYLLPLMTLAFLMAYFFQASVWKRTVLFLASIPTAVLLNSLRIGLIGVTVEYWGSQMAEGVLHDFEGWVVFMLSALVLVMVAAVLAKVGTRARLRDVMMLDFGPPVAKSAVDMRRSLPTPFLIATALATVAAVISFMMPERVEVRPSRAEFAQFPSHLGGWESRTSPLDPVYSDALKLDDYLLADFGTSGASPINVWIAYYDSQRKGQSAHSPKACLPGGGWEFVSFGPRQLNLGDRPITVNRALIQNGDQRQVMYYWFQERGRQLTNEYAVKWFIFQDALTRNRTDGALVRLMVALPPGVSESAADGQLTRFTALLTAKLPQYVPD